MGYVMATRFYDQPVDLPYLAVGRTDGQAAAYVYLTRWDGVDGDLLRGLAAAAGTVHPWVPRQPVHLVRGVVLVPDGVEVRHGLGLLGRPERLELG
jgi:hypothetical protein